MRIKWTGLVYPITFMAGQNRKMSLTPVICKVLRAAKQNKSSTLLSCRGWVFWNRPQEIRDLVQSLLFGGVASEWTTVVSFSISLVLGSATKQWIKGIDQFILHRKSVTETSKAICFTNPTLLGRFSLKSTIVRVFILWKLRSSINQNCCPNMLPEMLQILYWTHLLTLLCHRLGDFRQRSSLYNI
jgi:hypothetical protein